jgi:hypothetical protein
MNFLILALGLLSGPSNDDAAKLSPDAAPAFVFAQTEIAPSFGLRIDIPLLVSTDTVTVLTAAQPVELPRQLLGVAPRVREQSLPDGMGTAKAKALRQTGSFYVAPGVRKPRCACEDGSN